MNKKQEKIYNWLKEHKGYLKKNALWLRTQCVTCPDGKLEDYENALIKARNDFKTN